MLTLRAPAAGADLTHGQIVIVVARWILIGVGLFVALFEPDAIGDLRLQVALILGLGAANFLVHAHLLRRTPVPPLAAYAASAADLAAITLLVAAQGGFESNLYVLYFPALMAVAVAFPAGAALAYAGLAAAAYGCIALATAPAGDGPAVVASRVLMLGAVAFCGHAYGRIEDSRRRRAGEGTVTA
jgi:hypothetical protein